MFTPKIYFSPKNCKDGVSNNTFTIFFPKNFCHEFGETSFNSDKAKVTFYWLIEIKHKLQKSNIFFYNCVFYVSLAKDFPSLSINI